MSIYEKWSCLDMKKLKRQIAECAEFGQSFFLLHFPVFLSWLFICTSSVLVYFHLWQPIITRLSVSLVQRRKDYRIIYSKEQADVI